MFRLPLLMFALALVLATPKQLLAELNPDFMAAHSVRVIVRDADRFTASSGFLWKSANQIVTSLHAIPNRHGITVECGGVKIEAMVVQTLPRADLALLQFVHPARQFPSSCVPLTSYDAEKPESGSGLWAYGYNSGARSGTSKHLLKGSASVETLSGLLNPSVLKKVKDFGIPDTELDIYFVQGGAAPGYSGAPVVDKSKNLVGIVDGGLDRGLSDYNWLIPAKNLKDLLLSATDQLPHRRTDSDSNLFSTVTFDSDAKRVIEYEHQGKQFSWVWTKTRSLAEIAATADIAEGVDNLLSFYAPFHKGKLTEKQFVFDIYQERDSGIVIALPKDAVVTHDNAGGLFSRASEVDVGTVTYSTLPSGIKNNEGKLVEPSDPNFFQAFIAHKTDCNSDGRSCAIDPGSVKVLDDGQANKLLRIGIVEMNDQDAQALSYSYYTIAVRGNTVFAAQIGLQLLSGDCLLSCDGRFGLIPRGYEKELAYIGSGRDRNLKSLRVRKQIEMLISANLVSFSDLASGLQKRDLNSVFSDPEIQNQTPDTPIFYSHGTELRFVNFDAGQWEFIDGVEGFGRAEEIYRENTARGPVVILKVRETGSRTRYLIPINGGPSYKSNRGGFGWQLTGVLRREIKHSYE